MFIDFGKEKGERQNRTEQNVTLIDSELYSPEVRMRIYVYIRVYKRMIRPFASQASGPKLLVSELIDVRCSRNSFATIQQQ